VGSQALRFLAGKGPAGMAVHTRWHFAARKVKSLRNYKQTSFIALIPRARLFAHRALATSFVLIQCLVHREKADRFPDKFLPSPKDKSLVT